MASVCVVLTPSTIINHYQSPINAQVILHHNQPLIRSKTQKRLKEHFLIGQNRTKRANFRGSPLFQVTYNIKTEKQTINSTYLVSVRCSEAGGRKRSRDWLRGLPQNFARFVLLRPVKKHSFNLLSVLGIFVQNAGSQLCFSFFFQPLINH